MIAPQRIKENYWENFTVEEKDIEYIYNLLLEEAIPLPVDTISDRLIAFRIDEEKKRLESQFDQGGNIYLPKNTFKIGDVISFTAFDMQEGKITSIREGFNPDLPGLMVIDVDFGTGKTKSFASQIENHPLNNILDLPENEPALEPNLIKQNFGDSINTRIEEALIKNEDLVRIAGNWFPRSLLVDVHIGHLNLAEAILEEAKGGPVSTASLMKQVELKANVDEKLLEFSFDLALQEDSRFDEVGPAGETLWFLKQFEPEDVKEIPQYLKYRAVDYPKEEIAPLIEMFEGNLFDELEAWDSAPLDQGRITLSLSYPHWRSGTLPLSPSLKNMFPTAYEAPRIKFTFFDAIEKSTFPGWVVRPGKYISGLNKWYSEHEIIPGSLINVAKGKVPGEITIGYEKSRQNKEWLKTVLIGSDHGFVFAMLKHPINANFNERMAIAIPDKDAIDEIWDQKIYEKEPMEKTVLRVMRELSKLNPQGQVHALELYAAVNIIRRCPPGVILHSLINNQQASHLGDLYFRLSEKE